ncbi:MAG: hypothetical protein BroJett003_14670 [Planctomycetota bacterium]|nr:MAG: hypothetical protein BroJett003_14670 [Planctomycetota bacterium]
MTHTARTGSPDPNPPPRFPPWHPASPPAATHTPTAATLRMIRIASPIPIQLSGFDSILADVSDTVAQSFTF